MTREEAAKLVFMLFAAYPQGSKLPEKTVEVYEHMLSDLDFSAAQMAIARLIQSAKFLPTIAEVRAAARDIDTGPRRTGMEAWGDVTRAVRLVGSYRAPEFSDPIVAHTVGCIGWLELCLGDNEAALRARFIEAYEAASTRERSELSIAPGLRLAAPLKDAPTGLLGYLMPRALGEPS